MVTIKDVAKYANVSPATVSNVLNNNTSEVGYRTRQTVLKAIKELNYTPNINARSLKRKTTQNIGVVMLHTEPKQLLDPWTSQVVSGIVDVSREHGYSVYLDFVEELSDEQYSRIFREKKTDGVIILGAAIDDEICTKVEKDKVTHVFIDRYTEETKTNCVCIDNKGGAITAVNHLFSLGHRKIAYIGASPVFSAGLYREQGYLEAMQKLGCPLRKDYICRGNWTEKSGYDALLKLLQTADPPTAIFCASDRMAFGALQAAQDKGVKVPDELSIMGFDNIQFSAYTSPGLTTLSVPMYEMGKFAATQIIAMNQGKKYFRKEVFKVQLVSRESTAALR